MTKCSAAILIPSMPLKVDLLAIFSKPPVAGSVKTRLASDLGRDNAALLAGAFLEDTLNNVKTLSWASPVLATPEPFPDSWDEKLEGIPIWDQGDGDLGKRMERVFRRGFTEGAQTMIIIGGDLPGLPMNRIEEARTGLASHDAVLGPARDGGYYLIGLKTCPKGLLSAEIPWSSPETFEATDKRLQQFGLSVTSVPSFFDIDTLDDLGHLKKLLDEGKLSSPLTLRTLKILNY